MFVYNIYYTYKIMRQHVGESNPAFIMFLISILWFRPFSTQASNTDSNNN